MGKSERLKIISFSLWGNDLKYVKGAVENAKLATFYYPDWMCRFYIGKSTLRDCPKVIDHLKSFSHVQVIEREEEGDWTGMFWRFLACSDDNVDIVLSRDCDSRLNKREAQAVNVWLKSGKSFHIMRDHPLHKYLILGGLWGARAFKLRNMQSLIIDFQKNNYWNIDQEFLEQIIYPRIKEDVLIHDSFNFRHPFPTSRKNFEFVGEVFDSNNIPDSGARILLREELERRSQVGFRIKSFAIRGMKLFSKPLKY